MQEGATQTTIKLTSSSTACTPSTLPDDNPTSRTKRASVHHGRTIKEHERRCLLRPRRFVHLRRAASPRNPPANASQAACKKRQPQSARRWQRIPTLVDHSRRRPTRRRSRWASSRKVCSSLVENLARILTVSTGASGQTTSGTNVSASDQITNMQTGSADHLDMNFRKKD